MKKLRHEQALDQFVTYLLGQRGFEPHTASRYRANCERWFVWLGRRRKNWGEATLDDCVEFFADFRKRYSSSYAANMLSALRHLYEWGMDRGHVHFNHWRKIDRPEVSTNRRPILAIEDMERIAAFDTMGDWYLIRNKALMLFLYSTGLRNKEARMCNVKDIDFRHKRVAINNGKGGANGYGPLLGPTLDLLRDWIENVRPLRANPRENALWVDRDGERMEASALRRAVRRIERETGIRVDVTPHGIRKTAGMHLLRNGAKIHDVQQFYRHKRVSSTEHYLDFASEHGQIIAEEYHPLNRVSITID